MDTGSSINIYGHLFGWHVYDMLYIFIKDTGLWTIPFFVMFFNIFSFVGFGESDKYNPGNALVAMERYVYPSFIVIAVFLYPSVNMNKLSMTYDNGSQIQKVGMTGTQYDRLQSMVPNAVKIPIGWYLTLKVTSGINTVMKAILPDAFQARDLMYNMQQIKLDNPQLEAELKDYIERCRIPAQARLNAIRARYPDSKIAKKLSDLKKDTANETRSLKSDISSAFGGSSTHWKVQETYPGNLYFMDYLYKDNLLCKSDENPNTTECIPKTGHPLKPPAGKNCVDMWDGYGVLTKGIVDKLQIEFKGIGGELGGALSILSVGEDKFVSTHLNNNHKKLLSGSAPGNKKGDILQWAGEKGLGLFINIANVVNSITNSVIRFILPVAQAVVLMLLFMLLVILILFSGYSLPSVTKFAILLFGVSFLTSIWNIIGWIDNVMLTTINGGVIGVLEKLESAFDLEKAVWDLVVFAAYGFSSFFWLKMMGELGAAGSHAVGEAMGVDAGNSVSRGRGMFGRGKNAIKKTKKNAWDALGKGKK